MTDHDRTLRTDRTLLPSLCNARAREGRNQNDRPIRPKCPDADRRARLAGLRPPADWLFAPRASRPEPPAQLALPLGGGRP